MDVLDLLVSPYRPTNAIKAVDNGDGTTTLSGLAVVFDTEDSLARDFEGDFFTKGTFLSPKLARGEADEFEATFHHGIATRDEFKGLAAHEFTNPVKAEPTDAGLLVSLILDERDEYERQVAEAGKAGALGWSIGSAPHRARKTRLSDGRNRIDRYPIVEVATTHRPMEPRTFAVPLKSLLTPFDAPADNEAAVLKALREAREGLSAEHQITHALRATRRALFA